MLLSFFYLLRTLVANEGRLNQPLRVVIPSYSIQSRPHQPSAFTSHSILALITATRFSELG